ncbi:MAG: glycosyltransferase family 2 protein [Bacteroidales bacterium]
MKPYSNLCFRISNRFRTFLGIGNKGGIPVIINNRNRYTMLKQLISKLESLEIRNIHIIDNNSDYSPLLRYYNEIPYHVYFLDQNAGCYSLWKTHIFQRFKMGYYVYTDSDLIPVDECPRNLLIDLKKTLDDHSDLDKVGLGLKIDDLPDANEMKQKVLNWEKQYWEKPLSPLLYDAPVDTTFALYKPGKQGGWWLKAARTGYPYMARHLPWYLNSSDLPEEEKYYIEHANIDSSWYKNPEKNK